MICQTVRFYVLFMLLTPLVFSCGRRLAAEDHQLNVVFVLCDDHRFDCLGAVGHPFLETPNIDALATQGAMLSTACILSRLL